MIQGLADRVTSHCLKKNNRSRGHKWHIAEEPELVKEVLRQKQLSDSVYSARAHPLLLNHQKTSSLRTLFPNKMS